MSQEFMPCPCCGSEVVAKRKNFGGGHGGAPDTRWFECGQCGLRSAAYFFDDQRNAVLDAWNSRYVPEGYALVPVEPTEEMLEAGYGPAEDGTPAVFPDEIYKAMIKAAQEVAQ